MRPERFCGLSGSQADGFLARMNAQTRSCFSCFVRSIKTECMDRLIFLGENHLWANLRSYEIRYNRHRNHQGMENQLLMPSVLPVQGRIRCDKQLGGLLNYYYRKAA